MELYEWGGLKQWRGIRQILVVTLLVLPFQEVFLVSHGQASDSRMKAESFDHDPSWEGFKNWIVPAHVNTVVQDFGFSPSNFAGKEKGEIGGEIWRATTPAFYAAKIPPRTLNDKLTASGSFAITSSSGSSGVFFGWFNARQPGGGRPINSLGLDLDGEGSGARLAVRMISADNKSCGTFITPFIPGKYRPTPIQHNVRYRWTLDYDPTANHGNGRFQFTIKSDKEKREEFEGRKFSVDVPEHIRKEGATFDRFGLMNMGRPGNAMRIYFDDVEFEGRQEDFAREPEWRAVGNRVSYQEENPPGAQKFGFSPETRFADGKPGEIGGAFWRGEKNFGYYADPVGPFTLANHLEASGKVMMQIGAPDSGMLIGWFKSAGGVEPPKTNFLAVAVTGPTRIGHYFSPAYATSDGTTGHPRVGPIIVPGKVYKWKMTYDPDANAGLGAIQVTFGGESVALKLKNGDKARGASFDRFGLFTSGPGGGLIKIYFDELAYSAKSLSLTR